jgi:hypothetical protein
MIAHALEVPEFPCEVFHASQRDWTLRNLRTDPAKTKKSVEQKKKGVRVLTLFAKPTGRSCGPGSEERGERGRFPDRVVRGQVKFVLSTNGVPASRCRLRLSPPLHPNFFSFQTATLLPQLEQCCPPSWLGPAQRHAERAQHG